jgi:outer membrane protein OmpA-like peptidoglycan-associated protein
MRRARWWIIGGAVLAAVVAIALIALPPVARRVVVSQLRDMTGRDVTIRELRVNVFTGRLSLSGFRMGDREGPLPLAEFERLDVRFRIWPLLRGRLHLDAIALERPRLRVVRFGPDRLNVSDLLARFLSAPPPRGEPMRVAVGRLMLTDGVAIFDDRAVSPPQTWEIGGLRAEVHDLATVGGGPNGRANVTFALGGAPVTVTAEAIGLRPAHARAVVAIRDLNLAPFWSYVRTDAPIRPERGRFETRLTVEYDAATGVRAGGDVTLGDIALVRRGESAPLVSTARLAMTSRDIVYRDGVVTAARLELMGAPTIVDASVSPPRRLDLRSLKLTIEDVAWPARGPARVALAAELPEAGTLAISGTAGLDTRAVDLTIEARDVALAPYRRFLPVNAPIAGRAGATLNVKGVVNETPRMTVSGTATAGRLTLGPGASPALAVERLAVSGLEAEWPTRVRVGRVTVEKPSVLLEREKDGSFPLRTMLSPSTTTGDKASPAAAPGGSAPSASTRLAFEIGDLTVADGDARFVDRTTTPFYSEEIKRLALAVHNLRNAPAARADIVLQGIVGTAGAVDLRGQVAPFGEPFFLDVTGELRDFAVPRANPYLRHFIDWVAGSGRLTTKVHYRVVGDQLEASNDIVVERLNVERAAATADKKIGIPLALAVAIMKDTRGDIRLSVPVGGRLSAPEFSFGEAIATAFKNVMTKLVTAPFRAIGKIFQKGDTVDAVTIDPVLFEPGSTSVTPEIQKQVQRVADVLRASPQVWLSLQPVVSERDVASLRLQEVTARVQRLQREDKVSDFAAAAARVFKATYPERPAPKTTEEIVAALAEGEQVSDEARQALASRRLEAIRRALTDDTGIEAARLQIAPATPATEAKGDGRIEFELTPS